MTLDHKAAYLNAAMVGSPVYMMLNPEVSTMLCNIRDIVINLTTHNGSENAN
jgi:hypothetical protein